MLFRRRIGNSVWHWCANCSHWPTGQALIDYIERMTIPTYGDLDDECRSKEDEDSCERVGVVLEPVGKSSTLP